MRTLNLFFVLLLLSLYTFGQAPGNITSGLQWWFKANSGVYRNNGTSSASNGQTVQLWDDLSSNDNDVWQTTGANKPVYLTNRINGNPTLEFSGNQFLAAESNVDVGSTESFNMFLVFRQDSYISGAVNDGNGTFIIDRTTETDNLMSFKMVDTNKYNYQKRNNSGNNLEGPVSNTVAPTGVFTLINYFRTYNSNYGIYIDGKLDVTTTDHANDAIAGPELQIGRHAVNADQGLDGEIAEIILYNTTLTNAQRNRIESYLAIKYGIALDQTTLTDYVNSAGTVIYPVASTSSYNAYKYDIAGIGRDNNSGLNQNASQSLNAGSVVAMSNPSSLGSGDFLVWGDNGASMISADNTDVDGIVIQGRLSRVWRVAETNNVGTVTISFDLSAVTGTKDENDLRLLIDRDHDGFYDNDRTPLTGTLSGDVFTVAGVNFTSGDYFTIGTTDVNATPLPIKLGAFNVEASNDKVHATWRTNSEENNAYFILERSSDEINWDSITFVSGHGNSNVPLDYAADDHNVPAGQWYYRLRQTDYDGHATYSGIRKVFIESSHVISAFPNPSAGSDFYINAGGDVKISGIQILSNNNKPITDFTVSYCSSNIYRVSLHQPLSAGVYFVRVRRDDEWRYVKLVVM